MKTPGAESSGNCTRINGNKLSAGPCLSEVRQQEENRMSKGTRYEFKRISYKKDLNARQKENFNFQKVAARLADYGFNCIRLSDDWQGADFIASHIDGNTFLKIQLKGCLTFQKKYIGKNIYIAFNEDGKWHIYPHDELLRTKVEGQKTIEKLIEKTKSWKFGGAYHWPRIPKKLEKHMARHAI